MKSIRLPETRKYVLGLFLTAVSLAVLGTLFVFEASVAEAFTRFGDQYFFVKQQIFWVGVGLIGLCGCVIVPTKFWKVVSPVLYCGALVALVAVFIPGLGIKVNGARRWLDLGFFVVQPVEILKLGVVTFFARWLADHQKVVPFLFLTGLPSLLIILQPDMGSMLLILAISGSLFIVAGGAWKHIVSVGIVGVVVLMAIIAVQPYRLQRVTTFLNPELDPLGSSFHIRQITLALGNGGLVGQGIGRSKQKYSYIPESSTDSIFAIISEEIGFIGGCVIIGLFIVYAYFGIKIALAHKASAYEFLLSVGIISWICSQVLLNLSAVVALVPLTGVPLPFISYGGSSMVMLLCATGILMRVGLSKTSS